MSRRGTEHLAEALDNTIHRHTVEYEMTAAEVLGCIELVKEQVMESVRKITDDDDGGGESWKGEG